MPLSLANRITFVRILAVPVFILLVIYYKGSMREAGPNEMLRFAAMAVFGLALSLDIIDGYIARKRNEISKLGAILDPIADKSLLLSGFILLGAGFAGTENPHLPPWFVILVISRDVVLIVGALVINYLVGSVKVRPRLSGKAATFCQTAVIAMLLLKLFGHPLMIGVYSATLFTLISAVEYIVDGIRQIERV
jgi:CDP-diacylglycerol--glycerol-3-phosphate 3-phosphatidyltransferase